MTLINRSPLNHSSISDSALVMFVAAAGMCTMAGLVDAHDSKNETPEHLRFKIGGTLALTALAVAVLAFGIAKRDNKSPIPIGMLMIATLLAQGAVISKHEVIDQAKEILLYKMRDIALITTVGSVIVIADAWIRANGETLKGWVRGNPSIPSNQLDRRQQLNRKLENLLVTEKKTYRSKSVKKKV